MSIEQIEGKKKYTLKRLNLSIYKEILYINIYL